MPFIKPQPNRPQSLFYRPLCSTSPVAAWEGDASLTWLHQLCSQSHTSSPSPFAPDVSPCRWHYISADSRKDFCCSFSHLCNTQGEILLNTFSQHVANPKSSSCFQWNVAFHCTCNKIVHNHLYDLLPGDATGVREHFSMYRRQQQVTFSLVVPKRWLTLLRDFFL